MPPKRQETLFEEFLEAEYQRRELEERCALLREQLGLPGPKRSVGRQPGFSPKRRLAEAAEMAIQNGNKPRPGPQTAEARARIGAATKAYWAKQRAAAAKDLPPGAKLTKTGKVISKKALAALRANAKLMRARLAEKRAAAQQ